MAACNQLLAELDAEEEKEEEKEEATDARQHSVQWSLGGLETLDCLGVHNLNRTNRVVIGSTPLL